MRRIAALEAQLARLVLVAPLTRVSSSGNGDQVQAGEADGTTPQRAFTAQRFQHAGFKSTPVVDTSARGVIAFARNGISNGAIVAEDDGYDPGLAAGEAVIYSPTKHACRIYFDNAGVLHIDADSGQDVVVNGGSANVVRAGDHSGAHVHTATFALTAPVGGGAVTGTITIASTNPTIPDNGIHFKA